jgi:hypothetical protein
LKRFSKILPRPILYSNLFNVDVVDVGSSLLVSELRLRPITSPSFTGAIISSKISRGICTTTSSSFLRVVLVEGRTSLRIVAQKGTRNQLEGNDTRGTCAAISGGEGGAGGGVGGASTAVLLGLGGGTSARGAAGSGAQIRDTECGAR